MEMLRLNLCICACLCSVATLANTSGPTLPFGKTAAKPVIDGKLSPGEWDGASVAKNFVDNTTGKPVDDQTTAYITADEQGVYVAFRCLDPDAKGLIGRSVQPGSEFEGEDFVSFLIDPFHRTNFNQANEFHVNCIGTPREKISGGRASKVEWRGEWVRATTRDEAGYTVELFIPWKILSLPGASKADVEINFARHHGKKSMSSFWADITQRELAENNGVWKDVPLPARHSVKRFDVLGYGTAEYDNEADKKFTPRIGFDVRYRPNQQMTGVLSVNPDFRNIESEIAGIEFTRTERFLEDSRPFFTEGAGFFDMTGEFTFGRMFYSRRIQDFEQGAKYFGDIGANDRVGALVAHEAGDVFDGVFRYGHRFGPRTSASVFGTAKTGMGNDHRMVGASGSWGAGNWGSDAQVATSHDNGDQRSAGAVALDYSVPRFFTTVKASYVQPGFDPALAYVPYDNRRGAYWYTEYNAEYRKGPYQRVHAESFLTNYETYDGHNQDKQWDINVSAVFRNDIRVMVGRTLDRFMDEESTNYYGLVRLNFSNPQKFARAIVNSGERAGHKTSFFRFDSGYRLPNKMDIGLGFARLDDDGIVQQTIFTLGWELDKYRSITARLVGQDSKTNWYLAYRRAGGRGLEWYVIVGDPNANEFQKRVALKLVWAA